MKKILILLILYSANLFAQTETECPFAQQKYVPYDGMIISSNSYLPENYRQLIQNNNDYDRAITHLDNAANATCFYKTSIHNNDSIKRPFVFVEGISFEKGSVNNNSYTMGKYFSQEWIPNPPQSEPECLASFNSAPQHQSDFVGYSTFNWATLVTGIDAEGYHAGDRLKVEKAPDLLNKLCCAGYDICFVDFASGEAYIESNGEALYSILVQLHDKMVENNSVEKMVVCGASMGGLVARYAINKLEAGGHTDWVEKFISFDSPQMGANIPLSVQYTLKHLKGLSPELNSKYEKLVCPSASQLVNYSCLETSLASPIAYTTPSPSIERTEMLNGPFMGWPQHCTKIAISNGSRLGTTQSINHEPGDKVLDIDGLVNLDLFALPLNTNNYKKVFDFDPPYCLLSITSMIGPGLLSKQAVHVKKTMALDLAPGSYRTDLNDIAAQLPSYITGLFGQAESICSLGWIDNSTNSDRLCFIPIMSSIGMKNYDNIMKSHSTVTTAFLDFRFDGEPKFEDYNHTYSNFDIMYAPSTNQSHVEITDENIDWVMDELTDTEAEVFHENRDLLTKIYKSIDRVHAGNNIFNNPICSQQTNAGNSFSYDLHCGDVRVLSNESVYYKAGNFVCLDPGFYTEDDAFFQAEIIPILACYSSGRHAANARNVEGNSGNQDNELSNVNQGANTKTGLNILGNTILLFPNPANNYFDINCTSSIESLTINSVMGTMITRQQPNENNFRLNTSDLANGVYLITIKTKEETAIKKIVVKHE